MAQTHQGLGVSPCGGPFASQFPDTANPNPSILAVHFLSEMLKKMKRFGKAVFFCCGPRAWSLTAPSSASEQSWSSVCTGICMGCCRKLLIGSVKLLSEVCVSENEPDFVIWIYSSIHRSIHLISAPPPPQTSSLLSPSSIYPTLPPTDHFSSLPSLHPEMLLLIWPSKSLWKDITATKHAGHGLSQPMRLLSSPPLVPPSG